MEGLVFKKMDKTAIIPLRATCDSVGYDLSSKDNGNIQHIKPNGKISVETGLQILHMPNGCYGRIAPRSGFSWHNQTNIGAGVIDPDYRGEIKVVIFNHSNNELKIQPGEKIAQLILERCKKPLVYEVKNNQMYEKKDENNNVRGEGGFGSTGK